MDNRSVIHVGITLMSFYFLDNKKTFGRFIESSQKN